ncbi:sensor histidine kinase [Acanthopleuribacter pedis]|uniref:histidine kinase n=1 Tax=Acanthopleuribacter pedis TaxID=442870 RepID=A0A8J7U2P6_9BACT|nr:HAMP domain-containing sensor histidine kinase [Acanthopleuribacter pedis]MBO1317488.1 HAMP domain-containing histidine kinase [Acanthopleuribacter pedis]
MLQRQLLVFSVMCALFLGAFYTTQHKLVNPWLKLALNPEMSERLMDAIDNQKALAQLDPEHAALYREQFEQTQLLLQNMEVLRESHEELSRRYQLAPAALFTAALLLLSVLQIRHQLLLGRRLNLVRGHLQQLAAGEPIQVTGTGGLLGRIDSMIAEVGEAFNQSRRKVKQLENLQQWQESSRRIAHEIKTPLTSLSLETKNLSQLCQRAAPDHAEAIQAARRSIEEEIRQLDEFTRRFTSFSKIGTPQLAPEPLDPFLASLVKFYSATWPGILLQIDGEPQLSAMLDKRLLRLVLVNLCNNAAAAIGDGGGTILMGAHARAGGVVIEVRDDGPGIDPAIQDTLFEPYVSTKDVGEGMGLGLAISKKIMLDHGGDLVLQHTDQNGTCFGVYLQAEVAP